MKDTGDLLSDLKNAKGLNALDNYIKDLEGDNYELSFSSYLQQLIDASGLKNSDIIDRSNIERSYFYQILNGRKNPGRNKIISIALALGTDLEVTQRLLILAGEGALYSKHPRDSILIYSINNHMSPMDTGFLLADKGFEPLE